MFTLTNKFANMKAIEDEKTSWGDFFFPWRVTFVEDFRRFGKRFLSYSYKDFIAFDMAIVTLQVFYPTKFFDAFFNERKFNYWNFSNFFNAFYADTRRRNEIFLIIGSTYVVRTLVDKVSAVTNFRLFFN